MEDEIPGVNGVFLSLVRTMSRYRLTLVEGRAQTYFE